MRPLLCIALLLMSPLATGQNAVGEGQGFKPYEEITLFRETEMAHLNNRVLYFVHFTCPYCRNSHKSIRDWGDGIPASFDFEVIPAVGTDDHLLQAIGYYAALVAAPKLLRQYEASSYRILQDARLPPNDPNTYVYIAIEAGIDRDEFLQATRSDAVTSYVKRALMLTAAYGLNEVPAVVLANRFIAKPVDVQNQNEAFITVLNGLFSMNYQERQAMR
jgi:hypothetical protein